MTARLDKTVTWHDEMALLSNLYDVSASVSYCNGQMKQGVRKMIDKLLRGQDRSVPVDSLFRRHKYGGQWCCFEANPLYCIITGAVGRHFDLIGSSQTTQRVGFVVNQRQPRGYRCISGRFWTNNLPAQTPVPGKASFFLLSTILPCSLAM